VPIGRRIDIRRDIVAAALPRGKPASSAPGPSRTARRKDAQKQIEVLSHRWTQMNTDREKKNNRRGRRGTQRRFLGDFSALLCVLCGSNFFRPFEGRGAESWPAPRPTLFASVPELGWGLTIEAHSARSAPARFLAAGALVEPTCSQLPTAKTQSKSTLDLTKVSNADATSTVSDSKGKRATECPGRSKRAGARRARLTLYDGCRTVRSSPRRNDPNREVPRCPRTSAPGPRLSRQRHGWN
jgi:hypothetical protein